LLDRARAAGKEVPDARRADWEKLLAGFSRDEPDGRRRERIGGLKRACELFRPPPPRQGFAWEDPVDRVRGLGPAARDALAKAGIATVADLVWTLPVAWDDLRAPLAVREAIGAAVAEPEKRLVVAGRVRAAGVVPLGGRRAVRVVIEDRGGKGPTLHAWWFFAAHGVLRAAVPGAECLVVGRVRVVPGKIAKAAHPDFLIDEPRARTLRPRYVRPGGVSEAALRKAIGAALDGLDELPDPVPRAIAARERMPPINDVLRGAHGMATNGSVGRHGDYHAGTSLALDAEAPALARRALDRLAWAEAFTRVWERLFADEQNGGRRAPALALDKAVLARLRAELGFALTRSQSAAIRTIASELAHETPMRRLLLGDVGTGKTAVALAAAAQCVAAGWQVALLAPTSVLAEQYMDAVAPLARATGAAIALVAAGAPAAARRRAREQIAEGRIAVAIGTHALLSQDLAFARLGLVVVDEQHRLGVAQRLALMNKGDRGGSRPHLLSLSATPIPRTLALALRGELATSTLTERPKGRPPAATEARARADLPEVLGDLRAACSRGERAFFVSPRIEIDPEDEEIDPSAGATERARELASALAPVRVALVHGGMSAEQKTAAMRAFRSGDASVLVGTTVIEVGVDVPEATLIVIDHAERFGLAQLHQMRGRVGRGERPGRCILLHDVPLDALARRRLDALCALLDGEAIARADLELRGAGDLGGTRQHGVEQELLYLDPSAPPAWLGRIEEDARAIYAEDPGLERAEHRALRGMVRRLSLAMAVRAEAG
jgi:ATP-dependent DNA helicase RecG